MNRDDLMKETVQRVLQEARKGTSQHKEAVTQAREILASELRDIRRLAPSSPEHDERTTACRAVENFLAEEESRLRRADEFAATSAGQRNWFIS